MTTADPDKLAREVSALIEQASVDGLVSLIDPLHAADLAAVMERLDRFEQNFLFDALDPEVASQVLVELEHATREDVLEDIAEERIAPIVDELESDDAADVIGELDEETRARVLKQVPAASRTEVEQLLTYDDDSAGGIMALEVAWVRLTHSVAKAIEMVRLHYREIEEFHEIFVVDQNHRLAGKVTPTRLLLADQHQTVEEIMDPDVVTVHPDEDQEVVATLARKYDLVSLAVVDGERRLLGLITHDDIFDVIDEEEQENISYMAGTGEDAPAERSALRAVQERGPWLLVGLGGGVASALIMKNFEASLTMELAFFLPAIMAMAGSVAIQASSLVVRGIATGTFALHGLANVVWREFRVSVLFGIGLGLILGSVAYLIERDVYLSLCAFVALGVVIVNAALLGTLIPLSLSRLGHDPAVATGPFITTLNDALGILVYLVVISLLYSSSGARHVAEAILP